jgi:hypothetical protein
MRIRIRNRGNKNVDSYPASKNNPDPDPDPQTLIIRMYFVCSAPEETRAAPPSEDSNDAVHRRFLKESPAMFKDGVMEVSKDNEIAYSEVAKVSPCKIYIVLDPVQIRLDPDSMGIYVL